MTVPIAARDVAAAAGAHVLSTVVSVVGTVIVPTQIREQADSLGRQRRERDLRADRPACGRLPVARPDPGGQAAVILLGQLAVWLWSFYVGYPLLIWPATRSFGTAFRSVRPALWTFGFPDTRGSSRPRSSTRP